MKTFRQATEDGLDLLKRQVSPSIKGGKDSQLNVYNLRAMRMQQAQRFEFLRFDPNNDCNVHCVYCHNERNKDVVSTEEFRAFLKENIVSVKNFQVGCIMEPTLDPRLCDLASMIASSCGKPSRTFVLQTNGILLHRHDYSKLRDAGLTHLSVSIDAADAATHKALRGGTSLPKVFSNLASFHQSCPSITIVFMTTVTRLNIGAIADLVTRGIDLGATKFVLREVLYDAGSGVVDHQRMSDLILEQGAFAEMKDDILARFGGQARFEFADIPRLNTLTTKMKSDSFR